ERGRADDAFEQAGGVAPLELDRLVALTQHSQALGVRTEGPHDDPRALGVRPEKVVRVGVLVADDELELLGEGHGAGPSSRRRIPRAGTATQSGRLFSS